ncbi:hypothetical protein C8N40_111120 [Pontibacter mucosus]|uniref:Uncharacterized protein n=1 Tax=Pontibacter mucosus TaxID=1649266 RepID=A0A2T5YD77_9BACT|nr:hypothetical protein [Pontibacter mucosus]PTX14455.1 hypothetical protein C8N40_111120 [Pontibacter mucosus]
MAKLEVHIEAKATKTLWYYYVLGCAYLGAIKLMNLAENKPIMRLHVNGELSQTVRFSRAFVV